MLSATTPHRVERGCGKRLACEQGHRAHKPLLDDQRIAGKSHQSLPCCPLMIAEAGISQDRIGQMGLPLLGNQADLELADPDT